MKKISASLILAYSLFISPVFAETTPLKVVTTFSILGDLTKQVGGDLVEVKTLVGPDGDAHTYSPTPNDSIALTQAELVVENGLGIEGWFDRLVAASGYKGQVVVASKGVSPRLMDEEHGEHEEHEEGHDAHHHHQDHEAGDPHAWQDVSNVRIYVKNITEALVAAMPDKGDTLRERAKAYDAKLEKLDKWVRSEIAAIPSEQRKIITSHDAFGYFGKAYGVTFLSPQGISTEAEPSARQFAKLVKQIRSEKVRRVFFKNLASPKLATQLASDAGASVGKPIYSDALSKAEGPASSYIDMMHYNVEQFKEAMLLNGK